MTAFKTRPLCRRPRGPLPALIGRYVLPGETLRLHLEWDGEYGAVEASLAGPELVVLIPTAGRNVTGRIGTLAEITDTQHYTDQISIVEIVGIRRVQVSSLIQRRPYPVVTARSVRPSHAARRLEPRIQALIERAQESTLKSADVLEDVRSLSPSDQADRLACLLNLTSAMKRSAVRTLQLDLRLQLLERHVADDDDNPQRHGRLAKKPEVPEEPALPEAVQAAIDREELDGSGFGDRSRVITNFLKDLCWTPTRPAPEVDLKRARELLDESHAGLEEVKSSMLDHLATLEWRRRQGLAVGGDGLVLCLVGPPGTGKTSIVSAIAEASHRRLEQIPLGGCDSVYLNGCDRGYSGSRPGEIMRRIRASKMHPSELVILLDEVDKIDRSSMRNPVAILLALLDPMQNHEWQDQCLGMVPIDLSAVVFIATANEEQDIPAPLRDRMRLIHLPGYTREQQVEIGLTHLLPRLMAKLGVDDQVQVSVEAMAALVVNYPLAEGMRPVEQRLAAVVARGLRRHLETRRPIRVDPATVRAWLPPADAKPQIGFRPR